jgi:hypothetical protein
MGKTHEQIKAGNGRDLDRGRWEDIWEEMNERVDE